MIRYFKRLLLATVLACGATAPALADWARIGSVEVGFGRDRDSTYSRFGGGVDKLRLEARDGDVQCRSVRATFASGSSREIFSGTLRGQEPRIVELPGNNAHIRRIDFSCRGFKPSGTNIAISADISHYQDEWRRSPDWNSVWAAIFNGGSRPGPMPGRWTVMGTQRFDDKETIDGSRRPIRTIAVRAEDSDAVCRRVLVHFGNGSAQDIRLPSAGILRQGEVYPLDLPGNARYVTSIDLFCSATSRGAVRISVLERS